VNSTWKDSAGPDRPSNEGLNISIVLNVLIGPAQRHQHENGVDYKKEFAANNQIGGLADT
jgi:hypothetical protein